MGCHLLVGDNFKVSQVFWGGWYICVSFSDWVEVPAGAFCILVLIGTANVLKGNQTDQRPRHSRSYKHRLQPASLLFADRFLPAR